MMLVAYRNFAAAGATDRRLGAMDWFCVFGGIFVNLRYKTESSFLRKNYDKKRRYVS